MTKQTGGPAFPATSSSADGLTIRDYFAAKAMQELIGLTFPSGNSIQTAAKAYEYADAMLAERSK